MWFGIIEIIFFIYLPVIENFPSQSICGFYQMVWSNTFLKEILHLQLKHMELQYLYWVSVLQVGDQVHHFRGRRRNLYVWTLTHRLRILKLNVIKLNIEDRNYCGKTIIFKNNITIITNVNSSKPIVSVTCGQ